MPLPLPPQGAKPAGYRRLVEEFSIRAVPHHVETYVSDKNVRREEIADGITRRILPVTQWPGDATFDHLKFALRAEGLNLGILRGVLIQLEPAALAARVHEEPTGAYARMIWFLFEAFTGTRLDIPDSVMGNYVPLADPDRYYTGPTRRSARHRVALNLLGDLSFSFMVRKTAELAAFEARHFDTSCHRLVANVPPEIFQRALDYLYLKETRSSFQIERETPDQRRATRFVQLLRQSDHRDYFDRDALIALQNAIVDPRFANSQGWRDTAKPPEQNFVSGRNAPNIDNIHYIPPRPQEIGELMQSWIEAATIALESEAPAVVVAAAVAWGFVFLHPFSDGNGRIHRFLIHHVLARRGFVPDGLIFPVSAAMLDDPRQYDASLEAFSRPLLERLNWTLDEDCRLQVEGDSSELYRFIDYTAMATALYHFVERTVERDLPEELAFLRGYDQARNAMRQVIELPDPVADRFIQFARQNGWKLSKAKRHTGGLEKLTDQEISRLEEVVRLVFEGNAQD